MLTIKNLKELIKDLPDDTCATAYEGEGCGLQVFEPGDIDTEKGGWIETGYSSTQECNPKKHDLKDFGIEIPGG